MSERKHGAFTAAIFIRNAQHQEQKNKTKTNSSHSCGKRQVLNLSFLGVSAATKSPHSASSSQIPPLQQHSSFSLKAPVLTALLLYMLDMHLFLLYILQLLTLKQSVTPLRLFGLQHKHVLPSHPETKQKKFSIVYKNYKNKKRQKTRYKCFNS